MALRVVVCIGMLICIPTNANSEEPRYDAFLLPAAGRLPPAAQIDLGVIEPGSEMTYEFSVTNATGAVVEFDSVEDTCNCTSVSPKSGTVGPGDSIVFRVKIGFSSTSTKIDGRFGFHLKRNSIEVGRVYSKYQYKDFAGFIPRVLSREFAKDKIPTAVELPIAIEGVSGIAGFEAKFSTEPIPAVKAIKIVDDPPRVQVFLDGDLLDENPIRNQIAIFDPQAERRDVIPFLLSTTKPVSVFPGIAKFQLTKESADGPENSNKEEEQDRTATATLIALFSEPYGDREPKISFRLSGFTGEGVIQSSLGQRMVFQCRVPEAHLPAEGEGSGEMRVVIQAKSEKYELSVPFIVTR